MSSLIVNGKGEFARLRDIGERGRGMEENRNIQVARLTAGDSKEVGRKAGAVTDFNINVSNFYPVETPSTLTLGGPSVPTPVQSRESIFIAMISFSS